MASKLTKFTLSFDDEKSDWALKQDKSNRVVRRFENKGDATRGGALSEAIGQGGGSVKIQKQNGKFQEERTYPRSKDPKRSKG